MQLNYHKHYHYAHRLRHKPLFLLIQQPNSALYPWCLMDLTDWLTGWVAGRHMNHPDLVNLQQLHNVAFRLKYLVLVRNATVSTSLLISLPLWFFPYISLSESISLHALHLSDFVPAAENRTAPCPHWVGALWRMLTPLYAQWKPRWPTWRHPWRGTTLCSNRIEYDRMCSERVWCRLDMRSKAKGVTIVTSIFSVFHLKMFLFLCVQYPLSSDLFSALRALENPARWPCTATGSLSRAGWEEATGEIAIEWVVDWVCLRRRDSCMGWLTTILFYSETGETSTRYIFSGIQGGRGAMIATLSLIFCCA